MRSALVVLVAAFGIAACGTIASAQGAQNVPPLELTAQVGYLPLYGGEAGSGSISTWAASARVAYRLPIGLRHLALEAYLAHAPQDHDPRNHAPAFTFMGALARLSLRPDPRHGVDLFVGTGLGRMRVEVEEIDCPPPSCFDEGGPDSVTRFSPRGRSMPERFSLWPAGSHYAGTFDSTCRLGGLPRPAEAERGASKLQAASASVSDRQL